MSDSKSTLGGYEHSIGVAILSAGGIQNLATLIEAHFDTIYGSAASNPIKAANVFFVKTMAPSTGTLTFCYAADATEAAPDANHYVISSTVYAQERADCQRNAKRCWVEPSTNMDINIVVYTDTI